MASRSVNSGGSIKARKGNGAERLIAYNLMLAGYEVTRLDDNTAGIDLIAFKTKGTLGGISWYIEVKFHQKFSWNEIRKIHKKTATTTKEINKGGYGACPIFVFKSNRQPWLVAYVNDWDELQIKEFVHFFNMKFPIQSIPKGYKVWKDNKV